MTKRARVEGTRIIRITCDSTIPEVGGVLNVMVADYASKVWKPGALGGSTNQWLDNQLQDQKNKLEEAETN